MKTKIRQEHNHDPAQLALGPTSTVTRAVARRSDPATSHAAAASVMNIRAAHRRVAQLFTTYGAMSDEEALEAAKADGWSVSPSGLRTRRGELCPPRGAGIRDSGRTRKLATGRDATVWERDPDSPDLKRFAPEVTAEKAKRCDFTTGFGQCVIEEGHGGLHNGVWDHRKSKGDAPEVSDEA